MDTTLISAMSAVLGSLVGGAATVAATWAGQRTLHKRQLVRDEMRKREALYRDFIAECAKLLMDALGHTLEKPETLVPVYALLNRIRLSASQEVLDRAEDVLTRITDQYFAKNRTVDELREITRSKEGDPLRMFGEACRAELKTLRGRI